MEKSKDPTIVRNQIVTRLVANCHSRKVVQSIMADIDHLVKISKCHGECPVCKIADECF
jgi:hypothetical protein